MYCLLETIFNIKFNCLSKKGSLKITGGFETDFHYYQHKAHYLPPTHSDEDVWLCLLLRTGLIIYMFYKHHTQYASSQVQAKNSLNPTLSDPNHNFSFDTSDYNLDY